FVGLIEPRLSDRDSDRAALAGLRAAIDNLEDLARLTLDAKTNGKSPMQSASTCSPASNLERAVQEISRSHPDIDWSTASDGSSPELPLSDAELREILLVLLRNAAEAMNGRGRARVDMRSDGCEFRVAVSDEGEGFSPEARSRIFAVGYTSKAQGSGFGLFLARRLVEKHGGRLELLRSTDTGTAFEILLPVAADTGPLAARAPAR
ncbi:MAG: ATP-binding protein, partial [Myxococcota bacterium]